MRWPRLFQEMGRFAGTHGCATEVTLVLPTLRTRWFTGTTRMVQSHSRWCEVMLLMRTLKTTWGRGSRKKLRLSCQPPEQHLMLKRFLLRASLLTRATLHSLSPLTLPTLPLVPIAAAVKVLGRLHSLALAARLNCSAVHFLYTSDPPEI